MKTLTMVLCALFTCASAGSLAAGSRFPAGRSGHSGPSRADPEGACCFAGTCQVATAAFCNSFGGTYQGDGVGCDPSPCGGGTTGACCLLGSCYEVQSEACRLASGVYEGDNSTCFPTPPCEAAPTGGCCLRDSSNACQLLDAYECYLAAGYWYGQGSSCTPGLCTPLRGACCSGDTCAVTPLSSCTDLWLGPQSVCDPNPCLAPPVRACCLAGGGCLLLKRAQCQNASGSYQEGESSCAPNPCGGATGACCVPQRGCYPFNAVTCALVSGDFMGENTTCATPCPSPVQSSTWGQIKARYH